MVLNSYIYIYIYIYQIWTMDIKQLVLTVNQLSIQT